MTSPISSTAGSTTLAIDTSGLQGSLAIGEFQVTWEKKAMHSEVATLQLEKLLRQAELTLQDVTRIAVNVGPGSFTGIRVGVNLARTLAYSLNIQVATFNSLALLASKYGREGDQVFAAIKAIQNFYYCAGYLLKPAGPDESLAPCSLTDGELTAKSQGYTKVLIEGASADFASQLEAKVMLQWLARWPDRSAFSAWKEVRPVYIRASEAEEKLLKGLLKT